MASFRSGIGGAVLLAVIPGVRRQFRWSMLPVAAAYAATLILFVLANRLTTSANAIFLQATAPLYLLLLGPAAVERADPAQRCSVHAGGRVRDWRYFSPGATQWRRRRPIRRAAICSRWPAA